MSADQQDDALTVAYLYGRYDKRDAGTTPAAPELLARIEALEVELDAKQAELDEALRQPWPKWAKQVLKMTRELSGYDGYDDQDGIDVAEEVREAYAELTSQIERLQATPAIDLHPATALLVDRFAAALKEKLSAAEKKYGYSDGWASPDWMDECRQHLREHIDKGDPRDVAAYCAFLWHHGESTEARSTPKHGEAAGWRCFHCGEVFTNTVDAAFHFGYADLEKPSCLVNAVELRNLTWAAKVLGSFATWVGHNIGHANYEQMRATDEWRQVSSVLSALSTAAPSVEPAPALKAELPARVTDEMVTAYLTANDAYWKAADELPLNTRDPGKWRSGTPREATRVSLEAAIAAAPHQEPGWVRVGDRMPEPGTECLVFGSSAWAKEPYARIDTWDEQHEAPVSWSSATIPIGFGWGDAEFEEITHWMPLPAAPKEPNP